MKRFRTGWISDIHLGSKGSKADALLVFLREYEFEKLYIVGDFIDVWQLRRGIYWPQAHNDVIQKILRAGRKGTRVIYIPGNHDEFVAHFFGHFGAVEIMPRDIHTTADGRNQPHDRAPCPLLTGPAAALSQRCRKSEPYELYRSWNDR